MRSTVTILLGGLLLQMPLADAQVINGQSTYESNLRDRPPVELEDSAMMPKPQPSSEANDPELRTKKSRSLYPSR